MSYSLRCLCPLSGTFARAADCASQLQTASRRFAARTGTTDPDSGR